MWKATIRQRQFHESVDPPTLKTLFSRERSRPAPSQLFAMACVAARSEAMLFNSTPPSGRGLQVTGCRLQVEGPKSKAKPRASAQRVEGSKAVNQSAPRRARFTALNRSRSDLVQGPREQPPTRLRLVCMSKSYGGPDVAPVGSAKPPLVETGEAESPVRTGEVGRH